jgi:hypothetical protein
MLIRLLIASIAWSSLLVEIEARVKPNYQPNYQVDLIYLTT